MTHPVVPISAFHRKAVGLILCGVILCLAGLTLVIIGGLRNKAITENSSSIIAGGILSLTGLIILIAGAMTYSKSVNQSDHISDNHNIQPYQIRHSDLRHDSSGNFYYGPPPKYDNPPKYEDLFPTIAIHSTNLLTTFSTLVIQMDSNRETNSTSDKIAAEDSHLQNRLLPHSSHLLHINNTINSQENNKENSNNCPSFSTIQQTESAAVHINALSRITSTDIPATSNIQRF